MKQKNILLSFDIEEFDLPEEYGASISENDKFEISAKGTARILDVIEKAGIRTTFFITGKFAEKYPALIHRMVKSGGEIASHGLDHSAFAIEHLTESKTLLEKLSGETVTGFRMARLAPVPKEEISKAGYTYESSLNPVWLPGRYNNLGKPLLPFTEKCGLWQFPVSAVPFIRFPLFWLSFKNLPLPIYLTLAKLTLAQTGCFNLYSHPWEYNAESSLPQWKIPGYITRHAGDEQAKRLEKLIETLRPQGEFITFNDWMTAHV